MSEKTELLPCPWCGNAAEIEEPVNVDGSDGWVVTCSVRECPDGVVNEDSQEEAIRAWNTRAPSPDTAQLRVRVAELERERDEYRRGIRAVRAFYCIEYLPDGTDLIAGASASDEVNATLDVVRGAMAEADGVVESHRHADSRVTELERERDEARRRVAELERERDDLKTSYVAAMRQLAEAQEFWHAAPNPEDVARVELRVAELEAVLCDCLGELEGLARAPDSDYARPDSTLIDEVRAALSGATPTLDALIADAVRAEREACAEVCDAMLRTVRADIERHGPYEGRDCEESVLKECAAAIRARGES